MSLVKVRNGVSYKVVSGVPGPANKKTSDGRNVSIPGPQKAKAIMMVANEYHTVREAAERFRVSTSTIYRWLREAGEWEGLCS